MFRLEQCGEDKPLPYFRQVESEVSLDPDGFYKRVCEALGVAGGRGSKAKIAEIIGITKTTAGAWERGEMPGINSLQNVAKVSELGNTSLHYLLTGQGAREIHAGSPAFDNRLSPEVRDEIRRQVIEVLGTVLSHNDRQFADSLITAAVPKPQKVRTKK